VFQHALDDVVGALVVFNDLLKVARPHHHCLVSARMSSSRLAGARLGFLLQFQFVRTTGEVLDEVKRILDFVDNAGGELTERGHLLRLNQICLCCL